MTSAPRSDAAETLNDDAEIIAAFKSNAPVITIAPNPFVTPTVSDESFPITKVPDPKLAVRSRGVSPSLFNVPLNVTLLFVVVSVLFPPLNVTAPA